MRRVLAGILLAILLSGCGILRYVPLEEPQGDISAVRLAPSVFARELQATIEPAQVELTTAKWVAQLDALRESFAQDLMATEFPFAAEESAARLIGAELWADAATMARSTPCPPVAASCQSSETSPGAKPHSAP